MLLSWRSCSYLIAIVSNQSGLTLKSNTPKAPKVDMKRLSDFKAKATTILAQLDLPISIYAATAKDEFRKPCTGMWRQLLDDHGLAGTVDLERSIFVGDAAGRSGSTAATKDFSCSDRFVRPEQRPCICSGRIATNCGGNRNFAENVGITFHTPDEYFLGEEPKPFVRDFDPTKFLGEISGAATDAGMLVLVFFFPFSLAFSPWFGAEQQVSPRCPSSTTPVLEEESRRHRDPLRQPRRGQVHLLLEAPETPGL